MNDHGHAHAGHRLEDTRRQILGIRFGKKPKPDPLTLGGGTKVGCCGTCVGAARPGMSPPSK